MVKCLACGGVYAPVLADGTLYFHACPALSDAEVSAALGLPLDPATHTKAQRDQLAAASRARPNARDENILSTAATNKGAIKAAGAGVASVP